MRQCVPRLWIGGLRSSTWTHPRGSSGMTDTRSRSSRGRSTVGSRSCCHKRSRRRRSGRLAPVAPRAERTVDAPRGTDAPIMGTDHSERLCATRRCIAPSPRPSATTSGLASLREGSPISRFTCSWTGGRSTPLDARCPTSRPKSRSVRVVDITGFATLESSRSRALALCTTRPPKRK